MISALYLFFFSILFDVDELCEADWERERAAEFTETFCRDGFTFIMAHITVKPQETFPKLFLSSCSSISPHYWNAAPFDAHTATNESQQYYVAPPTFTHHALR